MGPLKMYFLLNSNSINPQSANFRQKLGIVDPDKKFMPKLVFKFSTNESKNISKTNVGSI